MGNRLVMLFHGVLLTHQCLPQQAMMARYECKSSHFLSILTITNSITDGQTSIHINGIPTALDSQTGDEYSPPLKFKHQVGVKGQDWIWYHTDTAWVAKSQNWLVAVKVGAFEECSICFGVRAGHITSHLRSASPHFT